MPKEAKKPEITSEQYYEETLKNLETYIRQEVVEKPGELAKYLAHLSLRIIKLERFE